MRGAIPLFKVFGISINIHITFLLLLLLFLSGGIKSLFLIIAIFFFVTLHELCHSLVAKAYGIKVNDITLLPIGGVASMSRIPDKPIQEFLISLAGPLFNIMVVVIFYLPIQWFFGRQVMMMPLASDTWQETIVYIYKINFFLAMFNLIPAFPMDGGRILRALLAQKMGYQKATHIAVSLGNVFALLFAFLGIMGRLNIMLIAIAIFIYMAASSEELQVDLKETLKKIRVRDILSHDFLTVRSDSTLSKVLELIFHSRQEDFPVVDDDKMVGFVTRQDITSGMHQLGMEATVGKVMRTEVPKAHDHDTLVTVQAIMQSRGLSALPVMRHDHVIGVVTFEDIARAYSVLSQRR